MSDLQGLRAALVAPHDPTNVARWSGIPHYLMRGLISAGASVEPISASINTLLAPMRAFATVRNQVTKTRYVADRESFLLRRQAGRVRRRIDRSKPDLVLSIGSLPASYLDTSTPIGIWADATVSGMVGYYPGYTNWSARTITHACDAERDAISRAVTFVGASDWATDTAREQVPEAADRCVVVPFGANLEVEPPPFERTLGDSLTLLLVGVDWRRKGADLAVAATQLLCQRGRPAELHIVGCRPPRGTALPDNVHLHPFLAKHREPERQRLRALYRRADVLLLPSRAECFGVVCCEAAAFGLPSVAARTGGIPTAVLDSVTGSLVDSGGGGEEYADAIEALVADPEHYRRLSVAARERFETDLNWSSAATAAVTEILSRAG